MSDQINMNEKPDDMICPIGLEIHPPSDAYCVPHEVGLRRRGDYQRPSNEQTHQKNLNPQTF